VVDSLKKDGKVVDAHYYSNEDTDLRSAKTAFDAIAAAWIGLIISKGEAIAGENL